MSDNYIAIGTTPQIFITIQNDEGEKFSFSDIDLSSFHVYFRQDYSLDVIEKKGEDVEVDTFLSRIKVTLTQEDTLKFKKGYVNIEARWLFNQMISETEHAAGKTYIEKVRVGPVIKKEVI